MKRLITISILTLAICFSTAVSEATLVWDWYFINDGQTFGSTETVTTFARVENNSTAGETIGRCIDDCTFPDDWPDYNFSSTSPGAVSGYSYDSSTANLLDTVGIIEPGEFYDFSLGSWIPDGGTAADGNYVTSISPWLRLSYSADAGIKFTKFSCFNWNVGSGTTDSCADSIDLGDGGGDNNVVPEPATMLLMGGGLIGGAFLRRRKT